MSGKVENQSSENKSDVQPEEKAQGSRAGQASSTYDEDDTFYDIMSIFNKR